MVTQRSRRCVMLILSLTPSIFPPLPISFRPALTLSAWPALSLSVTASTLPVGNTSISTISNALPTPAITSTISPAYIHLFDQTSPRKSIISSDDLLAKKAPLYENPLRNSSKLTPVSSDKQPLHTAEHPTSSPSSPQPQSSSTQHPSTVSTSFLSASFLTTQTSPPPFAKTSPKILTSPPEAASSCRTKPLLAPPLPHTTVPMFQHQPFIVSWNIPDRVCKRYNISLDTSPFKGVATPAKVPGQFLSLFYTDRLGLYPHVDQTSRKQLNGGIPQRGDLRASLNKARADINYYITSNTSRGLAVIDWEEWRPLWDRNWGAKRIYQTLSVAHLLQTERSLNLQQATERAKTQFQVAAKSLMSGMLAMGRAMRPNYLWGFYLFPHCYNYGWEEPFYTGRCPREVRRQNDELLWLWESSSALYPSIYLQVSLADNPRAALMVRNRIQEALRVSALPQGQGGTAPVFAYMRAVFVDENKRFLSQADLVSTLGESAAVGVSGAVLWGASADYDDQTSCAALSSYLTSTLNPYITNVTVAAQLCSNFLCRGNGRCLRKNYNSNHYLHLNPENFRILHVQKHFLVLGRPSLSDLKAFSRGFRCQCYTGLSCSPRTDRELAKALTFSVKQGLYQKFHTLNKAMLEDTKQAGFTKDNGQTNLKV